MPFTFPRSDLDGAPQLLALLGSFWSDVYAGRAQLETYCAGIGQLAMQAADDLNEAFACLSRDTVPVLHTTPWQVVYALQSQAESVGDPARYGGGLFYDGSDDYGGTVALTGYPVAAPGLADVSLIFNRLTGPSASLVKGLDYLVTTAPDGSTRLLFRNDPFADPRWATRILYDASGNPIDAELALWLFRPSFDRALVYRHFGYVLGLPLPSSEGSKQLVGALFDAAVLGTSASRIDDALAALTGVPFAAGDETVLAAAQDDRGLLVLTDQSAYRLPAASTPLVAAGDVLAAGQPLCDAWQVFELNQGVLPLRLTAIAAGRGLLGDGYEGDITFVNAATPLVVTTDPVGKTRAEFALAGFPADLSRFWDTVHARGLVSGITLARLLDVRGPGAPTEPTAASLPATVNPLQFLAANVLRQNAVVVMIRAGALPGDAPGLYPLRLLRKFTPPHTLVLLLIELPDPVESAIMAPSDPGAMSYFGLTPPSDGLTPRFAWDGPPLLTGGQC